MKMHGINVSTSILFYEKKEKVCVYLQPVGLSTKLGLNVLFHARLTYFLVDRARLTICSNLTSTCLPRSVAWPKIAH